MMMVVLPNEKMNSFSRSLSSKVKQRAAYVSRVFRALVIIGSLVCFMLAIGCGYMYVLPNIAHALHDREYGFSIDACDVFDGKWVMDDRYPLYNVSECPFVEQGFNCLANGRVDDDYLKWRWKPKHCDIPRVNVQLTLEILRNKRVVFVGDSMSRTQWESLICLLMSGLEDKESVYEVNDNIITKQVRYLGVRFSSFNFTIEFYRSVFLVQHNWAPRNAPKNVRSALLLDKLDDISKEWINSDVLVFNSGQWWVPGKLFGTGCYFQVGESLKLEMTIGTAFRTALQTWSSWVDSMINPEKTQIFFRTFEPSHWRNLTLRQCNVSKLPLPDSVGKDLSPFSDAVFEVVNGMVAPVTVLHVTPMSAFRSDAHVGTWSDRPSLSDCSHWCLPGVPDIWNEILIAYMFGKVKAHDV
ncbi:protein trichome berefringence-like 7 [Salvia hispanica]|uniref:protein trichome berefringence-like 7 n=1 Tax=Salvia hispanica TaxID=49212 RepID=UPI002009CC4C|nr:protein trichome berefringence-like 7 [Salvia hispanica]XP_047956168.1 protein trichome berefringence-like 7 [Salvia hispanica]